MGLDSAGMARIMVAKSVQVQDEVTSTGLDDGEFLALKEFIHS